MKETPNQPNHQNDWKYGEQETEPVSSYLTDYYNQERGLHHPMANMLDRGTVLTSRSHEGVNPELDDLQE